MNVRDFVDRIREAFGTPPVRDESLDEAIKALNEARDSARDAARIIANYDRKHARDAWRAAEALNRLSKRLWSA